MDLPEQREAGALLELREESTSPTTTPASDVTQGQAGGGGGPRHHKSQFPSPPACPSLASSLSWPAAQVPSTWWTGRPGKGVNPGERGSWKVTQAALERVPIAAQVHEGTSAHLLGWQALRRSLSQSQTRSNANPYKAARPPAKFTSCTARK